MGRLTKIQRRITVLKPGLANTHWLESVPDGERAALAVKRLRIAVRGAVQGVGFRPFVYRLAAELGLTGWVGNTAQGVYIEVEGRPPILETFQIRLEREKPAPAFFQSIEAVLLDPAGYRDFKIRASTIGAKTALVMPDIATCPECRAEVFDPLNRRYRYPFTNCTHCGPRFSIIESLPYDRANTAMKCFVMCAECRAEYENPQDRRFHAQPNACPHCGPQLALWDCAGKELAVREEALRSGVAAIQRGAILALKGLGGFQLLVDARNEEAVGRLRRLKQREEKPFALMFPSLASLQTYCEVSPLEARLLQSAPAPIVLLRKRVPRIAGGGHEPSGSNPTAGGTLSGPSGSAPRILADAVAPGNPCLGAMLPYTPLHHLLLEALECPVVATSGNLSDEPICIDEREALERLGAIADIFLVHNRPIVRQVDDSVVRFMAGRELVLRRARGYAPLPIHVAPDLPPVMALGAHLKNSIAVAVGGDIFVSQHIGDLETPPAFRAFRKVVADFTQLYELRPRMVACDLHPDYLSTQFARQFTADRLGESPPARPRMASVQHHYAHVLACMAENEIEAPVLGVAWDGTGYGLDGTVWGGEFLSVEPHGFTRVAHLRLFGLPGGEKAVQEPRRSALGLLYEVFGEGLFQMEDLAPVRAFSGPERGVLQTMLRQRLQTPLTSSMGRLFDAVAALVSGLQETRFEGQAAMALEFALDGIETEALYPCFIANGKLRADGPHSGGVLSDSGRRKPVLVIDWEPMVMGILEDLRRQSPVGIISAKFHNTLVEAILTVARAVGQPQVALSGGCFQNRYLTERAVRRLTEAGFRPYWHQRVPPNDGGIALGQVMAAARQSQLGS